MAAPALLERPAWNVLKPRDPREPVDAEGRRECVALARRLAAEIAYAADADQWAIAVVGLDAVGPPDFEELLPRCYLESLNDGRPARYRMTLVLSANGHDLGTLRLGTLRPPGFSDLDVARARAVADDAAQELSGALDKGSDEGPAAEPVEDVARTQGVVIMDEMQRILVVTPLAEDLLGWRSRDVVGMTCPLVFDCRDADGAPLCGTCGLADVFERQEITPPLLMRMADPSGGRNEMSTSFWYLPPTGFIQKPRAMAVLHRATGHPGPTHGPGAGERGSAGG